MRQTDNGFDGEDFSGQQGGKRKKWPIVLLVVFFVACVFGGVIGGTYLMRTYTQIQDVQNKQSIVPELPEGKKDVSDSEDSNATDESGSSSSEGSEQQVGTIDFDSLAKQNPDIYAWIYIPDTHVNYPVVQSETSNDYYLTHSADGESSEVGAIFSEPQFNHTTFDDRVTILYGHNGFADVMFSDLHNYARQEYLDEHENIYIYSKGKVRTYRVFSAFSAGDRHIMDAFDLQSDEGFESLVDFLKNPGSLDARVCDVDVDVNDKVLVLSTCNTGALESEGRYLVCGVLVDEQAYA